MEYIVLLLIGFIIVGLFTDKITVKVRLVLCFFILLVLLLWYIKATSG